MLGNAEGNRLVTLVATVVSFIFVTFLVVGSSRAAFGASTTNANNEVSTHAVNLSHAVPNATVAFDEVTISPGAPAEGCIDVTYTSTSDAASAITVQAIEQASTGLEDFLVATVEVYGGTCTAKAALQSSTPRVAMSSFLSGPLNPGWTPAAAPTGVSRAYVVRLELDPALADPAVAQGYSLTFDLTWSVSV